MLKPHRSYVKMHVLVCLTPGQLLKSSIYKLWPCAHCLIPTSHSSKLVCVCAWPPSLLLKFSLYKLWLCTYCWSPTGYMSKLMCLCAWPRAHFQNPVYINCGPVLTGEAPKVICQSWCACVPAPRARFWNPVHINCGAVLTVKAQRSFLQPGLLCACTKEPASKIKNI